MSSETYSYIALGMTLAMAMPEMAAAEEDIEFVQEHLPEVAMDNRYATLPIWNANGETSSDARTELQTGVSATSAGALTIRGPMFALGRHWRLYERWSVGAFAFYDPFKLSGDREARDLQTLFAPTTPIERPVKAEFSGLDGTATDVGLGVNVAWRLEEGWLGAHSWIAGVLWQQMSLSDYRFQYRIVEGTHIGETGTIDFDGDYRHVVPFVGLELPRDHGRWATNAHALFAYPLPRRGVAGHITGPGFDIYGNTADVGNGKHFGDPSLTLGYTVTYRPAHVSFDVGTLLTQALLDPQIHRGIDTNFVMSITVAW
jgi:hypothetical protein